MPLGPNDSAYIESLLDATGAATGATIVAADVELHGGQVRGVSSARGQWQQRQGLLLRLRDRAGRVGLGEASPLPGYSPDTLAASRAELDAIAAALPGTAAAQASPAGLPPTLPFGHVRAPAARFALETALLDLASQRAGQPLWQYLRAMAHGANSASPGDGAEKHPRPPAPVPLNAVCTATDIDQALAAVAQARARGIHCIKLKIGRDLTRELAILEAVRAAHGDAVTLRVDANQAWTPAQAREALTRLAPVAPAYVEEPCPAEELTALAPLPVPVALDESLAHLPPSRIDDLLARGLVSVLVLKPMLLGGLGPVCQADKTVHGQAAVRGAVGPPPRPQAEGRGRTGGTAPRQPPPSAPRVGNQALACMDLAARARRHGAGVVVSHLFDGPVALAACAHLALAVSDGRACGLDRHAGLAAWPALDIPYLLADRIVAPAAPGLGVSWSAPGPP